MAFQAIWLSGEISDTEIGDTEIGDTEIVALQPLLVSAREESIKCHVTTELDSNKSQDHVWILCLTFCNEHYKSTFSTGIGGGWTWLSFYYQLHTVPINYSQDEPNLASAAWTRERLERSEGETASHSTYTGTASQSNGYGWSHEKGYLEPGT